ncbi:hypothetical protein Tco_0883485 [Tanacetum coccineum]
MLGAAGVQIPENNLDNLHSSKEEYGTSETMDPQDLLGSLLLADIDLIILGLCVSVSRAVGFLRGTVVVVVILVKGHAFPIIVKVRPVGCDPLALVDGFTPVLLEDAIFVIVFPEDVTSSVNLTLLSLFFGVTALIYHLNY